MAKGSLAVLALAIGVADVLALGDDAAALGVDVVSARRLIVSTSAVLTGASVAVAGLVGFVGLVVPHAVRLLVGPNHRRLIPASALGGSVFLILSDLAARTARPPAEIRLGVVTALCGAPFFLALMLRRAKGSV
jgi:iron complex transport system permease protein